MKSKSASSPLLLVALLLSALFTLASCSIKNVDYSGAFSSTDVDRRFEENNSLPPVNDLSVPPNFSFIVISDTHVKDENHIKLEALPGKIIPTDRFVITCGDNTQDGAEENFKVFKRYLAATGLPCYTTIGNHDIYNGGWAYYRTLLGRSCYTFKVGDNLRMVVFDSANGTLGAPQKEWLANILRTKTESRCLVFTHFQFFAPNIDIVQQYTDEKEIYYLMHLFTTYGANCVFAGHAHEFYDKTVNGVRYLTLDDMSDNNGKKHFIRVWVSPYSIIPQQEEI
jgi:predicted phosphodiesterase